MRLMNHARTIARRLLKPQIGANKAAALATREALSRFFSSGDVSWLESAFPRSTAAVRQPVLDYCDKFSTIQNYDDHLIVVPSTMKGRIEHFHHFFQGFLLPLILRMETAPFSAARTLHLPDTGPMNSVLDAVLSHYGLNNTVRYPAVLVPYQRSPHKVERAHLLGMDIAYTNRNWFLKHELLLFENFADSFAPAGEEGEIDVLFLIRKPAENYYHSASYTERYKQNKKYTAAGANRRSIGNPDAITEALSKHHDVAVVALEGMPLAEQIRLFRRAKIIVGQHGAGMNGIVWSRKGTGILEIIPLDRTDDVLTCFRLLAERMGARHTYLVQEGEHDNVDPQAVVDSIAFLAKGRPQAR